MIENPSTVENSAAKTGSSVTARLGLTSSELSTLTSFAYGDSPWPTSSFGVRMATMRAKEEKKEKRPTKTPDDHDNVVDERMKVADIEGPSFTDDEPLNRPKAT